MSGQDEDPSDGSYLLDRRVELARAVAAAPQNAQLAFEYGQFCYEIWQPAAALLERAVALAPDNLAATRYLALALNAEGQAIEARELVQRQVSAHPDWIEGHRLLIILRRAAGEREDYDRSFAQACSRLPENLALRLAWFQVLFTARNWLAASRVVEAGKRLLGPQNALAIATLYLESESGAGSYDPDFFAAASGLNDVGLELCKVRYALRHGRADRAATIAQTHIAGPAARTFWPYLSLAWRMSGDPRANTLDDQKRSIRICDLPMGDEELKALSKYLRGLHAAQGEFLEQSVRGGSQTDRHLFYNPDPVIQAVKRKISTAVQRYIANMPAAFAGHPWLGVPRGKISYAGAWSVLLQSHGYHSCHTHARGWLSSAFYVDLPAEDRHTTDKAGWLGFGTPPPELGLPLDPYRFVEPKPGRLVLFPSVLWHATEPFVSGDRLTMAFDVVGDRSRKAP